MSDPVFITRRQFTWLAALTGSSALVGCTTSDGDDPDVPIARIPFEMPPLDGASVTTERTVVPAHQVLQVADPRDPMVPEDRDGLFADGFGDYEFGGGDPVVERTPDDSPAPAPGGNARRLVRFVHASDLHIADDEAPTRLGSFDEPDSFASAARPQGAHMGRMLNAAVRTVNALHRADPIDFFIASGDCTDSGLLNEVTWLVDILSGSAEVRCDSGLQNDPVAGDGNDPKDPFVAEGLDIPWRFCMGNHDALIMGVGKITELSVQTAMGEYCAGGARNWELPGGPIVDGDWVADEQRRPLYRDEFMGLIAADGDGHGLTGRIDPNKANYTMDVDGSDVRFIVFDSACEAGGEVGLVRRSDLESFLEPALDQAATDGKWVVLVAHHPLRSIGDGSRADAQAQAEAVLPNELEQIFSSYPNVILSLAGHTHDHVARWVSGTTTGYWEVQTCSLVDFPGQMRLCEIRDEDNGFLSIELVSVDPATDGDDVAEECRRLMVLDYTSGNAHAGPGDAGDRNVRLYVPLAG